MSITMIVSFPMPGMADLMRMTTEVINVAGRKYMCGSGAGFGQRDVEFGFKDWLTAGKAAAKVAKAFPKYAIVISDDNEVGNTDV